MRPERDDSSLYFFDDDMAQYSISSLLGDSIDTIKKAEFRQRTASSAAKIKEIVSEIRGDVTVMEQRRSRSTTPIQKPVAVIVVPADVRPDPVKQHEQARRNREIALKFSPALKFKEALEREKKVQKKAIVKRKFSLVHSLPERVKRESVHYAPSSVPASYSMNNLLSSPSQLHHYALNQHSPPPLQYPAITSSLQYPPVSSSLQYSTIPYPTVSASLPSSPCTTPSAFTPIVHH